MSPIIETRISPKGGRRRFNPWRWRWEKKRPFEKCKEGGRKEIEEGKWPMGNRCPHEKRLGRRGRDAYLHN